MGRKLAPDAVIADIAGRQHGIVTTRQLASARISERQILRRARTGRLHRLHQGVYAVGHVSVGNEGRWMAAVLACGEEAVLSHRPAAALWGLLPAGSGVIDVTVPSTGGRKNRRGIRVHRSQCLAVEHCTRRQGIPVTTPARTIADLRQVAPALARRALRQASVIGLHMPEQAEADRTRSELESQFLALCHRHLLPSPEVNQQVGPFTVDFLWLPQRLIVETDGYRYHRGRQAFEDDRARDLALRTAGYEVMRLSFRQVLDEGPAVAAAVRRLLRR